MRSVIAKRLKKISEVNFLRVEWTSELTSPLLTRAFFVVLALCTFIQLAWIGDDALISFKQVWNFINGEGIVFNNGIRVQAFTHPLWFFLLSAMIAVTNEWYFTSIFTSIIFSVSAIIILFLVEFKVNDRKLRIFSPVFLLLFSWSFCDYTSSGLENALAYLLVSLLVLCLTGINSKGKDRLIYLILALLVLTRFDYGLLFLPIALVLLTNYKNFSEIVAVVFPGALILLCWHSFSLLYFGSPLPNTFYAKLLSDIPFNLQFDNGIEYLLIMQYDIASVVIILMGFLFAIAYRNKYIISLLTGQVLYILYTVFSGGDFMAWRFYSVPVLLSVGILALVPSQRFNGSLYRFATIIPLVMVVIIGSIQKYPFLNYPFYIDSWENYVKFRIPFNIATAVDERAVFFNQYGLLSKKRVEFPSPKREKGIIPDKYIAYCGGLGINSMRNPGTLSIDLCGLTDPYLARMPVVQLDNLRAGHLYRKIPTNMAEYLLGKEENVLDESLHRLHADVDLVARHDIFTMERLKAIWRLNTGYDYKIDWTRYVDKNIWIPNSTYQEEIEYENWEEANRLVTLKQNWKISAKYPKYADRIWITIPARSPGSSLIYDVYVNDQHLSRVNHLYYCEHGGFIIDLQKSMAIDSIKFIPRGQTPPIYYLYDTTIHHFVLLEEYQDSPKIKPECVFNRIDSNKL